METYGYSYPPGRGHPDFGLKNYGGIVVRRPTVSPSMVRDIVFASCSEAVAYVRSLPTGAAYDCRACGGYPDGGLCEALIAEGLPTSTVKPGEIFPWTYWPTEEERANPPEVAATQPVTP